MSDGKLTQEEIDALLGKNNQEPATSANDQPGDVEMPAEPEQASVLSDAPDHSSNETGSRDTTLSEMEQDVLGEIGNISFGSAATALSTCLNQKVEITTPVVSIVRKDELAQEFPVPYVSVRVNYTEGFIGSCMLVIKISDASIIANLMMGGDGKNPNAEISEMEMSAVQEAMNQMMGSSSTAMSTVFKKRIDISPLELTLMDVRTKRGMDYVPDDEILYEISFQLKIGDLIDSNIMLLLPPEFGKTLVQLLLGDTAQETSQTSADIQAAAPQAPTEEKDEPAREASQDELAAVDHSQPAQPADYKQTKPSQNVQPVAFSDFNEQVQTQTAAATPRNLDLLMDIPLDVSVELGHTRKTVREVLELGPGSIIELDKLAGEAIDILINSKYIAKGEVVVVDENFGIRITEILNHYDRLKNLN
ncbi:MAG: flagellar motor switch phosphatase FliY [Sporolactobacillus sp.]